MLNLSLQDSKKIFDAHIKYGHLLFYRLKETTTICRPLTMSEIEALGKLGDLLPEDHLYTIIFDKSVVYTTITDKHAAGLVPSIAESVVIASSYVSKEELVSGVEKAKESFTTLPGHVESISTIYNKNVDLNKFRHLTKEQQFKYYALSEQINPELLKNLVAHQPGKQGSNSSKRALDPKLAAEAARITSRQNADKPDIASDNAALKGMLS